jgi:hypothetical protein
MALNNKRSTKCNLVALDAYATYFNDILLPAKTRAFPPNIIECFPDQIKTLRHLHPDQYDALRDW